MNVPPRQLQLAIDYLHIVVALLSAMEYGDDTNTLEMFNDAEYEQLTETKKACLDELDKLEALLK
jgi:hypothetical protein